MSVYRLTPTAKADIRAIWSYIAADNVEAADRVEAEIHSACAFLAQAPRSGHPRMEVTDLPVLFWTVPRFPNYMIVYNPAARPLRIIRILHGARNISQLLKLKD